MILKEPLNLKFIRNINSKFPICFTKRHNHFQSNKQLKLQNCLSYWKHIDHQHPTNANTNVSSSFNFESSSSATNFFMPPESQKEKLVISVPPILRWKPENISQADQINESYRNSSIQNSPRNDYLNTDNAPQSSYTSFYDDFSSEINGSKESIQNAFSKDLNEIPNLLENGASPHKNYFNLKRLCQSFNFSSALISYSSSVFEISSKSLKSTRKELQEKVHNLTESWNIMNYTNNYSLSEIIKAISRTPKLKIPNLAFEESSDHKSISPSLEELKLSKDNYITQFDRKIKHNDDFPTSTSPSKLNLTNNKDDVNDFFYVMNSSTLTSSYNETYDKNPNIKILPNNVYSKGRDIAYMICNKGEVTKLDDYTDKKILESETEPSNNINLSKSIDKEAASLHTPNISLRNLSYDKVIITDEPTDNNTSLITHNELNCGNLSSPKVDDNGRNYCKDIPIEALLSNLEATIRCHGELNAELSKIQTIYKELLSKKPYKSSNEKSYEELHKRLRNWQFLTAAFSGLTFTCGFFYIDIGEYLGYYNQTVEVN